MRDIKIILILFWLAVGFRNYSQVTISVLSQTPPKCYGVCDGSITFSISGATGPYSVSVTNSTACITPTVPAFNGPTVTINNICPCSAFFSFKFYDVSNSFIGFYNAYNWPYTATSPLTVGANIIPALCSSCCNASVYCSSTGGTTYSGPSVFFLDGNYLASGFWPAMGVCPGAHTLCARDNVGCETCTVINIGFSSGVIEASGVAKPNYIQPNPSNDKFIYSGPTEAGSEIIILSVSGQEMLRKRIEIKGEQPEINISNLPKGMYFLCYLIEDSKQTIKLLIN